MSFLLHNGENPPGHEMLWVSLSLQGGDKAVAGRVYRPSSCPGHDTRPNEYLDDNLSDIRFLGSDIIIAANVNVLNVNDFAALKQSWLEKRWRSSVLPIT